VIIDGILDPNFPRPLSFYLSRQAEYLEAIKHLVFAENFSAPMAEPAVADYSVESAAPVRECIGPTPRPPN
jgi:hypothetical protein